MKIAEKSKKLSTCCLAGTLHNAPAVNKDALVVKIFDVFQVIATGAYYPILEFEDQYKPIFLMVA